MLSGGPLAIAAALLFLSWTAPAQMAVSTIKTGAPPSWAESAVSVAVSSDSRSQAQAGGQLFTFIDTQVNAAEGETFVHVVKEITSDAGVQSGANLQFVWDPSYQELIVHQITLYRGGEKMDRLDPARFKVIQQEQDLNRQVYNGALSAVLFLEDVRIGDRIEYSYTLRGENPALKEHFSETFLLEMFSPIERRRIRFLCPGTSSPSIKCFGTNVLPTVRSDAALREYVWDMTNLPAVAVEDLTPSWYPLFPWIELTEFANWSEVAKWGCGLFETTNQDAPEIKAEVSNLRRADASAPENVQRALDFVQNDVRYLGIEFGPNSYRPSDPVTVLQRRFGDCKDKAVLFCALVRGLGYEAVPVLIGTGYRHTLLDLLPAPQDFDHVIVRVVADGQVYWLDPTRSYQHAPIGERYMPDYGFGLALQPGQTELTRIPDSLGGVPETDTFETFDVGGQKQSARLSVTTTAKGFDAEWMRAVITSAGSDALAKDYLNNYARRYPGIAPSAPIVVEDSPDSDIVRIVHTYTITNFWTLSENKELYKCDFFPLGIQNWITKPTTAVRSVPLELAFPRRRVVHTEINLSSVSPRPGVTNTIVGPGGSLRVERFIKGNRISLSYEYESATNFISLELTGKYLNSLDDMEAALDYPLTWKNLDLIKRSSQFNWPIFLLAVSYTVLLAGAAGFFCVWRCRPNTAGSAQAPPLLSDYQLSGLGGWLILPCIGLFLSCGFTVRSVSRIASAVALWKWQALTTPGGASYDPLWPPLLIFELLGELTIFALSVFALILFFQKRRIFPKWYIAFLVFNAVYVIVDVVGIQMLKHPSANAAEIAARNLTRAIGGGLIWISYMCLSQRVKSTFVR